MRSPRVFGPVRGPGTSVSAGVTHDDPAVLGGDEDVAIAGPLHDGAFEGADRRFGLVQPARGCGQRDLVGPGHVEAEGLGPLDEPAYVGVAAQQVVDELAPQRLLPPDRLLCGPGTAGFAGGAEDVHVAAGELHHEEQYSRWRVMAQSTWKKSGRASSRPGRAGTAARSCRLPLGRRRDLQGLEDPADGRGADPVAELEQLALDPLVAPGCSRGRSARSARRSRADRWASGAVGVGPLLGDQAAVPPQDGARGDQAVTAQHSGRRRISAANSARSAQSRRAWGWFCGVRRPRAAGRAARRPWRTMPGGAVPASSEPAEDQVEQA